MRTLRGWVGCYTTQSGGDPDGGIGRLVWAEDGGSVTLAARTGDPSYLALHPTGRFLYAVNELAQGTISGYAVRGDSLSPLGSQPTHGGHPCHLSVDASGRYVVSANYSSGSLAVHPVGEDGALGEATAVVQHRGRGPDPARQQGPHAHMAAFDPGGRHLFAVDLGIDAVLSYRLAGGALTETGRLDLPPGTGPRHLAFHPSGHAAYLVGELDSTLTTCRHDDGVLTAVSTVSTRPDGGRGPNLPAAVVVAADGKRVHVTNRGDDTVATFDLAGGGLLARLSATVASGGAGPRDLARTAEGTLLAANERTGNLTLLGHGSLSCPAPTCVLLE
ncbi:MAG TPA: lactonase family protein [Dermatophilaceae bacterium]|nr:lactonase family protein [Dermatophilaceae bacterium]